MTKPAHLVTTLFQRHANKLDLDWFNTIQATEDFRDTLLPKERAKLTLALIDAKAVRTIIRSYMHPRDIERTECDDIPIK